MLHVVCAVWPPSTVANVDGEVALTVQPLGAVSVTLTLRRGAVPVFGSCVVAVKVEPGTATTGALSLIALTIDTAKMCIAVWPGFASWLTSGNVTYCTVLPGCSGTEA